MSNTVTEKERQEIQDVADEAILLDKQGLAENTESVINWLIARFGISKERAKTHAAKAARGKLGRPRGVGQEGKTQLNLRVTKITRAQVDEISQEWGMNKGDVVVLAVERLYQQLEKGHNVS